MRLYHLALALAALAATPAKSEVLDASGSGFAVADSVTVAAPPQAAWEAMIEPARWWSPDHSWSGDAANFSLDPRAGGCFCEALPDGGSAEHMRVIQAAPGTMLRMSGALGPLQGEALAGTLTVRLKPEGEGTAIAWTYVVGGHAQFALEEIAPAVDRVLGEQFLRLAGLWVPDTPE